MKRPHLPEIHERRPLAAGAVMLWIAISPWVWGFADIHSAVANHVALVFGFGPIALLIANLRAAAYVTLFGGAWLAISPWLLGYATDQWAWLNELIAGLLLIAVCASAADLLGHVRQRPGRLADSPSADRVAARTAGSRS